MPGTRNKAEWVRGLNKFSHAGSTGFTHPAILWYLRVRAGGSPKPLFEATRAASQAPSASSIPLTPAQNRVVILSLLTYFAATNVGGAASTCAFTLRKVSRSSRT
jgi:hypothetical protein